MLTIASTENSEEILKFQMGFEPTNLHDLATCSNHWATGDSMVSNGEMCIFWLEPHHMVRLPNVDL